MNSWNRSFSATRKGRLRGPGRSGKQGLLEEANGGTLFLDEIGELPLKMQSKLLRFLQEGEFKRIGSNKTQSVDVRILCATNLTLDQLFEQPAVPAGSLLPDCRGPDLRPAPAGTERRYSSPDPALCPADEREIRHGHPDSPAAYEPPLRL